MRLVLAEKYPTGYIAFLVLFRHLTPLGRAKRKRQKDGHVGSKENPQAAIRNTEGVANYSTSRN